MTGPAISRGRDPSESETAMSVLEILQNVCPVIGLPRPATAVGSTSAQVQTLLGLSQFGGRILSRAHPWQAITRRRTFTALAQNAQTGEPPEEFQRWPATQRIWDNTRRTWLIGPMSTNDWDAIMVRPQIAYPGYWCLLNGVINIAPAPADTDTFTYTFISKNWIRPQGAVDYTNDIAAWAANTDASLLDESLHELDLIWRYKQAKGLDYAEDMATFEREKEKAMARDRGPREITTTDPYSDGPPDGFWPGTITEAP